MIPKRPGYYVEQRYYRDNFHQARARAVHLSKEYGRAVPVKFISHEDSINFVTITVVPDNLTNHDGTDV